MQLFKKIFILMVGLNIHCFILSMDKKALQKPSIDAIQLPSVNKTHSQKETKENAEAVASDKEQQEIRRFYTDLKGVVSQRIRTVQPHNWISINDIFVKSLDSHSPHYSFETSLACLCRGADVNQGVTEKGHSALSLQTIRPEIEKTALLLTHPDSKPFPSELTQFIQRICCNRKPTAFEVHCIFGAHSSIIKLFICGADKYGYSKKDIQRSLLPVDASSDIQTLITHGEKLLDVEDQKKFNAHLAAAAQFWKDLGVKPKPNKSWCAKIAQAYNH